MIIEDLTETIREDARLFEGSKRLQAYDLVAQLTVEALDVDVLPSAPSQLGRQRGSGRRRSHQTRVTFPLASTLPANLGLSVQLFAVDPCGPLGLTASEALAIATF
jgi:hypothetical protein